MSDKLESEKNYKISSERWSHISQILIEIERVIEGVARSDARLKVFSTENCSTAEKELDRQLVKLELRVDVEIDRLTAEKLLVDLERKKILRESISELKEEKV